MANVFLNPDAAQTAFKNMNEAVTQLESDLGKLRGKAEELFSNDQVLSGEAKGALQEVSNTLQEYIASYKANVNRGVSAFNQAVQGIIAADSENAGNLRTIDIEQAASNPNWGGAQL